MADSLTPNAKFIQQVNGSNPTTWGDKTDANWDRADAKIYGSLSLATVGGTTSLIEAEEQVAAIDVSGTLAANATVAFSGIKGVWVVRNNTAGAYTVTCKVTGQTGVQISQGTTAVIWCNGTDIVSKVESAGRYIGELIPYAGTALEPKTLWANGQAVSRTTYALLFAKISTTYGVGNGSTTFNVPDLCGRVPAGQDDMGGIASVNRLTLAVTGGINGDTLGATGGVETNVLTSAQLAGHTHAVSGTSAGGSAHSHAISLTSGAESAHTHAISLTAASGGAHTHGVSAVTVSTAAAHAHSFTGGVTSSVSAGTPGGTVATTVATGGSHSHTVSGNTGGGLADMANLAVTVLLAETLGSGGSPNARMGGAATADSLQALGAAVSQAAHTHFFSATTSTHAGHTHTASSTFTGSALGTHQHSVTGSISTGGSHNHTLSGATDSGGAHTHSVSGASAAGSAHTHSVSGTSGTEAAHTHTFSVTSGSAGSAGPINNIQPTLIINYLIYAGV